jgi:EthD domain
MGRDDDAAAPADCLTLVMPLQARAGMTNRDFYEYWLNAHVTLPARFPGISSIFLHCVSFDDDADGEATWPRLPGVSHRPPPEDEFQGVPEATFVTMEGLAEFQAASKVQMDDGINFLQEMIAYRSIADATETVSDQTDLKAPDGHDSLIMHLLFLRRREGVTTEDFRRFVADTLAPRCAASPDVLKVRRHPFEEVEVTLDHPGVRMSRPLNRQYQAALEVVSEDLARFKASPQWKQLEAPVQKHCEAVHAARVSRCITTKYQGTITLAGVRGVAVADVIRRLGADSQLDDEVSALFLHTPAHVLI